MKANRICRCISFWGLPISIPVSLILYIALSSLIEIENSFNIPAWINGLIVLLFFLIYTVAFICVNIRRKKQGQDYKLFNSEDNENSNALMKAMYPDIPDNILTKRPVDLVLGKYKKSYVSIPIERDGINSIILGTPGAGKSVMIKNILLAKDSDFKKDNQRTENKWNYFLIDVDGLIYKDIYPLNNDYDAEFDAENLGIKVIEPSNRVSFGFDVFYRLREPNPSDTKIIKVMSDIADALVPESGDNPYFSVNAKRILSGVLIHGFLNGMEFVDIIQMITRNNLDELLTQIVKDAKIKNEFVVIDKLANFIGKSDNESIQDVESTMNQYLEVFSAYPDLIYSLKDNPNKVTVSDLNDGKTSVILSIETSMLGVYQPFMRLITMMFLRHIETDFKVEDERNTLYIVDEAARIGKVNDLPDIMAVARKYHVSILQFLQDFAQFNDIYGKDKSAVIRNLCELKIFMSGSGDAETTNYLKEIVGEYIEESQSYEKSSLINAKNELKYSESRLPIINGKSLMSLRDKNELIIIYYGKYYRFQKVFFFKDKYLKKQYESIKNIVNSWRTK